MRFDLAESKVQNINECASFNKCKESTIQTKNDCRFLHIVKMLNPALIQYIYILGPTEDQINVAVQSFLVIIKWKYSSKYMKIVLK